MATIPANVILIHIGSHASIPSGWTRETTLDDKFAKGWGDAVAPNETGGATTHTHTSASHTHAIASHTHTGTTGAPDSGTTENDGGSNSATDQPHSHTFTSGGTSGTSGASSSDTWGTGANTPSNRKVIFIKASAGAELATNIVALWGTSNTPPSNWSNVTELQGRYLLGAGTGADADLTTDGGSNTHTNTLTHNHSISHSHTGTTDAAGSGKQADPSGDTSSMASHTHPLSLATASETSGTDAIASESKSNEPLYRQLQAIKKGASGLKEKGIIGMWLGASTAIPGGWSLYTAMKDYHLKIGDPTEATGGANTHSHAATAHTHNSSATHTHTGSASSDGGLGNYTGGGGPNGANRHTHPITTTQAQTTALSSADIPATSTDNNEAPYRTVAFIKFDEEVGGGSFFFNLI